MQKVVPTGLALTAAWIDCPAATWTPVQPEGAVVVVVGATVVVVVGANVVVVVAGCVVVVGTTVVVGAKVVVGAAVVEVVELVVVGGRQWR